MAAASSLLPLQSSQRGYRETQPPVEVDKAAQEAGMSPEQLEKAREQLKVVESDVGEAKHEKQTENQTPPAKAKHEKQTENQTPPAKAKHEKQTENQTPPAKAKHEKQTENQTPLPKAKHENQTENHIPKAKHEIQTENQTGNHTESADNDPQVQMAHEMLEAAKKAVQSAREAHILKAQEVSDRVKLEDAVNISTEANATYERLFADYQAATSRSSQLNIELVEAKAAMVEATQLAGSSRQELDDVLLQWANANASAAETLGLLQAAQHTFTQTNQSLADAKAHLEKAKKEEEEAKKKTVDQAEKVLKAIEATPNDD